jgi:hypothetical protein
MTVTANGVSIGVAWDTRRQTVVLAKPDLIDSLGVAVYPSIPVGHLLSGLLAAVFACFRSRAALQLEILALRHQLGVLQRSVKPPKLTPDGSMAMGLPTHRLERLAVLQRRYPQNCDRHRLARERLSLVLGLEGPTR